MQWSSRASTTSGLHKNADGSVDIHFGPKAPNGKESNWIPTDASGTFEVLFRFYGPQKALFDKTWKLPISRRRAETINDWQCCDVHSRSIKGAAISDLAFAAVEDLEVVAGVGREEAGEVAQALGERRCGEERILALAQIVVIKIDCEREHVDGQGI